MPKIKTHSGAKKRFSLNAKGKVKATQAGANHYRRNKSQEMLRNRRGTTIVPDCDAKRLKKIYLPNG